MTIEAEFRDLYLDSLSFRLPSGKNEYGEASGFGPATVVPARIVHETRMAREDSGDEIVSRTHAYVYGAPGITAKHEVTLIESTGATYVRPVVQVNRYPDENGPHHEVVFFGEVTR